ncbi:hypothetical protein PACTADRAFT_2705 [Pachysolen tannophilus NRRL Y-2460]|uniref:Uncharacterized protein n=1 Tax=Pachysolen tannophilus NRRL Y-2460 TaxID=669874 RepID=A0A1E4TXC7_PACTA|nr:hypothetical protein PACTADRAFT_2705 [Pachysolen tannophilus NRRL Y-2460]
MDNLTYEALWKRVSCLEKLLVVSADAEASVKSSMNSSVNTSVEDQLASLVKSLSINVTEYNKLFKLLMDANLWNRLPIRRSIVKESDELNDDITDIKNIIISNNFKLLDLVKQLEELIMGFEIFAKQEREQNCQFDKINKLLNFQINEKRVLKILENYNKLVVKSIYFLNVNFRELISENEFWSNIENSLMAKTSLINGKLDSLEVAKKYQLT